MGTRIIQFGVVPPGVLAALSGNGYEVDACGTSILKLKEALQRENVVDAIAVAENSASKASGILTTIRSIRRVPVILLQDHSGTCDPSQFDLVIPQHAPLPDLLTRIAAAIERSRVIRAESEMLREQQRFLRGQVASLREQVVTAGVESRRLVTKRHLSETPRLSIPCVLVVDDYARWRDTMCSMLKDSADCGLICRAEDGIEAVQKANELKPQLILLDLDLPRMNGIEAARQISHSSPESAILFVSMNNSSDVVSEALSTGAKGYLLKLDAGNELWLAIEAVLQNERYLSCSLRGMDLETIN